MAPFPYERYVQAAERLHVARVQRQLLRKLQGRALVKPAGIAQMCTQRAPLTLVAVVRAANASTIAGLIAQFGPDTNVRLHALHGSAQGFGELAAFIKSDGPGPRMAHLRRLILQAPVLGDLVLTDDDVTFARGGESGRDFVALSKLGGFDLTQPSHGVGSHRSHSWTRARPLAWARTTNFVEVGPLVWMSPAAQRILLPLETGSGMGWGVDVEWARVARGVLQLGCIDGTPMIHHSPIANSYGADLEEAYLNQALRRAGACTLDELVNPRPTTWWAWRRRPPTQRP